MERPQEAELFSACFSREIGIHQFWYSLARDVAGDPTNTKVWNLAHVNARLATRQVLSDVHKKGRNNLIGILSSHIDAGRVNITDEVVQAVVTGNRRKFTFERVKARFEIRLLTVGRLGELALEHGHADSPDPDLQAKFAAAAETSVTLIA